jgi:hypothetical protein
MTVDRSIARVFSCIALTAFVGAAPLAAHAGQAHKASISASKAEASALKKYRSGKIQGKTALENEDGKWQYAVMVHANGKLHEVMVDAKTGKIASEEVVTAKEEAAEKRAEAAAKKHGKGKKATKSGSSEKAESKEAGEKE